jgi:hypothetical protein
MLQPIRLRIIGLPTPLVTASSLKLDNPFPAGKKILEFIVLSDHGRSQEINASLNKSL